MWLSALEYFGKACWGVTGRTHPFKRYSPTLLLLAALLVACAPMQTRHEPVPVTGGGAGGLLVLNVSARVQGSDFGSPSLDHVTDGVLLPVRSGRQARRGQGTGDILIFSDLPPGRYRLALVNASRRHGAAVVQDAFLVPSGMAKRLTFRVAPGAVVYGGSVHIERGHGGSAEHVVFRVTQNKKAELRTWNRLLRRYGDSRWGAAIRERVAELKGHT